MKQIGVIISLLAFSLMLFVLGGAEDVTTGKTVYTNRCKMCHGADGTGNPAMGRMLKVDFQALDSDYVQTKEDLELRQIITKGKGKMAAVRGLDDQDLSAVIAYIRSLSKEDAGQ